MIVRLAHDHVSVAFYPKIFETDEVVRNAGLRQEGACRVIVAGMIGGFRRQDQDRNTLQRRKLPRGFGLDVAADMLGARRRILQHALDLFGLRRGRVGLIPGF